MTELRTILLIEDNPDHRFLIERGLKQGFESLDIVEINSQKDLNRAIERGGFDLAITDYNLGWADGITVFKTIKKRWPERPAILMTAVDTKEIRGNAAAAGVDRLVLKSTSQFTHLPDIVRSMLAEKEHHQVLEQALVLNQTIIESIQKAVIVFDRNLRCVVWNTFMEKITGIEAEDSLGKTAAEVFPQIEAGEGEAVLQRVLQGETVTTSDIPYLNPETGRSGWSEGWYGPLISNDGDVIGVVATFHDITERKLSEAEHEMLLGAEQKRARELTTLNQLSTFAARTTDEDTYIEFLTKLISETFYPFNFGILFLDQAKGVLRPHRSYIKKTLFQEEIIISVGEGITGTAAQTGELLNVPDVAEFQGYLSYDTDTRSEICVPMKIDDKVIGVINAENPQPNAFDEADERLLNILASQISITLERFRTSQLEARHTRQLSILNQLGSQMTGILNRKKLCDQITQGLVSNFGYYNCGILTLSEDKEVLFQDSFAGTDAHMYTPNEYRQRVETGLIGLAVRLARPVVENDISRSKDFFTLEETRVQSELALPLIAEDQVIGVLAIDSDQRDAFDKSEVSALASLAGQLATALEKIRLFDQTTEALSREQLLNKVIRRLSGGLDEKTTLKNIVRLACETVGADSGSIGILSKDSNTLVILRGDDYVLDFNPVGEDAPGKSARGEGLGWTIIESGESILLSECEIHQHPLSGKSDDKIFAFIGVPVIAADTNIGALMVYNYSPDKQLTERDLALIESIGRQVGIAVQNARYYEETREALVRERVLNEITQTVSSALNLEAIIAKVTELTALLVGGDMAALSLVDPDAKTAHKIHYYNPPPGAPTTLPTDANSLFVEILREGKSFHSPNYALHPKAADFWIEAGTRAMIAIPLLAGEETFGVLGVFSKFENYFNQRDLELLESVAQQTRVAIQKGLLFEKARRRSDEIAALYDIALSTSSVLDTVSLLKQLHNKVQQLIQPDSYGVFLYDDENDELEIVMALDGDQVVEEAIGARFPLTDGGLTGWVMKKRKTLLIGDTERDLLPASPKRYSTPIRTWLGIPLIARDRLIGAISVQSLKPDAFDQEGVRFLESLAGQVAIALENARLYEELEDAFVQTVLALANAMDVRDTYTHDHSQRIAFWAQETGRLLGCSAKDLEILSWAALLHDIGKIGVPDEILLKPASLTEEEYEVIKQHPALGASIVAPVKKLKEVAPIIRHHQEKFDGSGYPDGLKGSEIPLASRILTVIDSYTAMTDERVYRRAYSHRQAVKEIRDLAGKQYDPAVVEAFIRVLEKQGEEND